VVVVSEGQRAKKLSAFPRADGGSGCPYTVEIETEERGGGGRSTVFVSAVAKEKAEGPAQEGPASPEDEEFWGGESEMIVAG
jgi:hypothetical protein